MVVTQSPNRAVRRAAALGVVTATMLAVGAAPAGAATTPTATQNYLASAGGSALDLSVYLPVDVPGLTVNHHLDLTISLTNGTATLNSATRQISTTAQLANTTSPVLAGVLDRNTAANRGSAPERNSVLGPEALPGGLGTVAIGPVFSAAGHLTSGAIVAQSSSSLADLTLVPTGLPALAGVTKTLTTTVTQALGTAGSTASGATTTLTGAVNTAVNQLNSATSGAAAPVVQAVQGVESSLTGALASVQTTLSSLSAAPALLTLSAVDQNHEVSRSGTAITSASSAGIGNLNVLGGLVSLSGLGSSVVSTAGGVPGSARVTFPAQPVLRLSVANNALVFLIDSTGLHLQGALSAIPPTLQSTVNGALGDLTSLLNQIAGVAVTYGKGTSTAAPNGTFASGQISPTTVTITPAALKPLLPAGAPYFMQASLVPVHAAVTDQLVAAAAALPVAAVTPHALAFTGADLPLSGAVATALLGIGVGLSLVRRRRRLY